MILVTGAAGFIGFHLCKRLLNSGYKVVGLDNINDAYDINLKYDRLSELGILREEAKNFNQVTISSSYNEYFQFIRLNLEDRKNLPEFFSANNFKIVVNLAAQVGVRKSHENPEEYVDSNIVGFLNVLECSRKFRIKHLLYASSSSVYGQNEKVPFSVQDQADHPISLYAATKKSNELMAHTYSHLFNIKTTGIRFFTVYGPWGRPDMAMFLFTDAIVKGEAIKIFNNGALERDLTYIDDIIEGIYEILFQEDSDISPNYSLYNIGNSKPVPLMSFIEEIENKLGKTAKKEMLPMQPGDVSRTWADVENLKKDYSFNPNTPIEFGIAQFIDWYKIYYRKNI